MACTGRFERIPYSLDYACTRCGIRNAPDYWATHPQPQPPPPDPVVREDWTPSHPLGWAPPVSMTADERDNYRFIGACMHLPYRRVSRRRPRPTEALAVIDWFGDG